MFFIVYTTIGNHGEIWFVILGVMACFKKTRLMALAGFIALASEYLLVEGVLKHIFQRPRPFYVNPDIVLMISEPSGYSFPSGHTASSFAVAWTLYMYNAPYKKVWIGLAALMGFSRLYVYVHFPTDVLAGALLGMSIGFVVFKIFERIEEKKRLGI